jgi:hypothetical protein
MQQLSQRRSGGHHAARLLAFLASLLVLSGCIDPIDFEVGEADRQLVVEGLVTEGWGPHEVRLTRTATFTQGHTAIRPPERGALVIIETSSGQEVTLWEQASGRYVAPQGMIEGIPGESYKLRVVLADGTVYSSALETMLPAPEIIGFQSAFEMPGKVVNGVLVNTPQIAVMVDAAVDPDRDNYYRWTWRGTYQADVCTDSNCIRTVTCYIPLQGRSLVAIGDDRLTTSAVLAGQRVAEFEINRHTIRYFIWNFHIEVEQQALSADTYVFWSRIRELRDRIGSLFDPPGEAVFGNVTREDVSDSYALGHFTVAGTTRASTCVRLGQFPERPPLPAPDFLVGTCGGNIPGSTVPPPAFREACL